MLSNINGDEIERKKNASLTCSVGWVNDRFVCVFYVEILSETYVKRFPHNNNTLTITGTSTTKNNHSVCTLYNVQNKIKSKYTWNWKTTKKNYIEHVITINCLFTHKSLNCSFPIYRYCTMLDCWKWLKWWFLNWR